MCTKMLRVKFPATTHGYSIAKIVHLIDAFSGVFLSGSMHSRRSITAVKKDGKRRKRPKKRIIIKKKTNEKP